MVVLTLCNHKGGTGKTTSTIHLAAALGLSGYRTLVVDLDPQGFLTRTLGVAEPRHEASTLAFFDPEARLADVEFTEMHGFKLLPSSSALTKFMRKLNKPHDVFWVRESLENAPDVDVVLLDTAAAVTVFSLNALVASQHVVIPVTPEYQPVVGAEQTYRTVEMVRDKLNPDLDPPRFLFTRVDARKRDHHLYRKYLRETYGDAVLQSIIRTNTALAEMSSGGETVFDRDPTARGARDYANAADEILREFSIAPPRDEEVLPEIVETLVADAVPAASAEAPGAPAALVPTGT